MAEEYTVKEFAKLCGEIADSKVDSLCVNVVKELGDVFLRNVIRETPDSNPIKIKGKSSTGLKKGWEENKNFSVTKGTKVYTAVISNKAKSRYSNNNTGKRRSDYYAGYVEDGHIASGAIIGKSPYVSGKKFTDKTVLYTNTRVNSIVGKEIDKWFNEVF